MGAASGQSQAQNTGRLVALSAYTDTQPLSEYDNRAEIESEMARRLRRYVAIEVVARFALLERAAVSRD